MPCWLKPNTYEHNFLCCLQETGCLFLSGSLKVVSKSDLKQSSSWVKIMFILSEHLFFVNENLVQTEAFGVSFNVLWTCYWSTTLCCRFVDLFWFPHITVSTAVYHYYDIFHHQFLTKYFNENVCKQICPWNIFWLASIVYRLVSWYY